MLTVDVVNEKKAKIGQVVLPDSVFAQPENRPLLHEATVLWLRNQRAGTASTKGRSEVSGGGRKPWKQKGTGRARSGSSRSPVWVGGGTVHGPKPRDFATAMPKKKRKVALRSALSLQYNAGNVLVFEGLEMEKPSSARIAALLKSLELGDAKVLLISPGGNEHFEKSVRNLSRVLAVTPEALNPYLVLYHGKIIIFKESLPRIEEMFG